MIKMLKNPLTQDQWRKLVNKAIGSMTMGGLTLDDISDFDTSLYYSDSLNPTELIESANCCAEDAMNNDNPNYIENERIEKHWANGTIDHVYKNYDN